MSEYHFGVTSTIFETVMSGCVFFLQLGVSPHSGFSPDGFSSTFLGLCFGVSKCVEEFRSFLSPNIFSGTSSRKKKLRASSLWGFYITYLISAKLCSKRFTRPKIRMAMENHQLFKGDDTSSNGYNGWFSFFIFLVVFGGVRV